MELSSISDVKLEEFKESRFVIPGGVSFKQVNDYFMLYDPLLSKPDLKVPKQTP